MASRLGTKDKTVEEQNSRRSTESEYMPQGGMALFGYRLPSHSASPHRRGLIGRPAYHTPDAAVRSISVPFDAPLGVFDAGPRSLRDELGGLMG